MSSAIQTVHPPINWYFDHDIYALEKKYLFDQGPGYVGHELMVPNVGDYYTLQTTDNCQFLMRNEAQVELISNICRHRQALMLKGHGNTRHIVCPIHRWSYDTDGTLHSAALFPENPCLNLQKYPIQNWKGLIFSGQRDVLKDLSKFEESKEIDFSKYMLGAVHSQEYNCNWKTFIEVYQEEYHVNYFHPGLSHFVNCNDIHFQMEDWYTVQTVGLNKHFEKGGSPAFQKWQEALIEFYKGNPPKHGAVWMLYYPNVMIEWYPHELVISTIVPHGPEKFTNVMEFYYPQEILLFEKEFVEMSQKAYHETAVEDEDICMRIHKGRKALYERGENQTGPYQEPMEKALLHFHQFLNRELSPHL